MSERFETWETVPATHPSLPGHFPGNPVVPGVVVLQTVARALTGWLPGIRVAEVIQTKFLHPLKPGQRFAIRLVRSHPLEVRFDCRLDDLRFATGLLRIEEAP